VSGEGSVLQHEPSAADDTTRVLDAPHAGREDEATGVAVATNPPRGSTDDTFLTKAVGWLSFLSAVAVTRYFGLGLLLLMGVLAGLTLVFAWGIGRATRPEAKPVVPALAVQVVQLLWMLAVAAYAGLLRDTGLDIGLLAVGLVWLWLRPGRLVIALLCLLQVIEFYTQVHMYASTSGTLGAALPAYMLGGVVVMSLVRVAAIALMVNALPGLRRKVIRQSPAGAEASSPL
jgi:hypothetical protein